LYYSIDYVVNILKFFSSCLFYWNIESHRSFLYCNDHI